MEMIHDQGLLVDLTADVDVEVDLTTEADKLMPVGEQTLAGRGPTPTNQRLTLEWDKVKID